MAKFLLLAIAAVALQTVAAAPIYSGDWLAQELGFSTPEEAQEAIKAAAAVVPAQSAANKITPEELDRAEQRRQPYQALMASGRKEEALKLIDNLIKQDEADSGSLPLQTACLRFDRAWALKTMNRYIEALVELQRMGQLLAKIGQSSSQLGVMAWRMEQELKNMNDFQKLQLAQGASKSEIRKSYKNLMMLLHPDKISSKADLDENAKIHIAALYDKVRGAYDTLMAN